MFAHLMRGFVLVFTGQHRHSSKIPPAFIACEIHDRLITARDGIQYGDTCVRVMHLQVLKREPPPHLQAMVQLLKSNLAITPEALSSWEAQLRSEGALL
jgi:hypothetical protein